MLRKALLAAVAASGLLLAFVVAGGPERGACGPEITDCLGQR